MIRYFATNRLAFRPRFGGTVAVLAVLGLFLTDSSVRATSKPVADAPAKTSTTSDTGNLSGLKIRLVGVINTESRPKALVTVEGVEDDMLVGEGDFLCGYTLEAVTEERIELARGSERQTVTMQHLRWIKADAKAKTLTPKPIDDSEPEPAKSNNRSAKAVEVASAVRPSGRPAFQMPMEGKVTSPFGLRDRPILGNGLVGSKYHQGVDIAASYAATIRAAAPGVVTGSGNTYHLGNYVVIEHSGGYETRYYHMSKIYMQRGQSIKTGQAVGVQGSTGDSTGPHLHFEIRKDGVALNPATFLSALKK